MYSMAKSEIQAKLDVINNPCASCNFRDGHYTQDGKHWLCLVCALNQVDSFIIQVTP